MDAIGEIFSNSPKGHMQILVATNYFTEWIGAASERGEPPDSDKVY